MNEVAGALLALAGGHAAAELANNAIKAAVLNGYLEYYRELSVSVALPLALPNALPFIGNTYEFGLGVDEAVGCLAFGLIYWAWRRTEP